MTLQALQQQILDTIDAKKDIILGVSRQIHDRPELGNNETFACGLLETTLAAQGFSVEHGFAGRNTAFLARKGSATKGPRVGFMAEYDALPEIGHACGHNIICSSALAAGIGLGSVIEKTGGEIWVVGTPAEETDGAKVEMAHKGAFAPLDVALMVHPADGNFYLCESLAMDAVEVEYFGKASHAAASPWDGKNALDALVLLFNSVGLLRQQLRPDARMHGIITDGGVAPNIIPEHSAARFYLRAKTRGYLDTVVAQFQYCAQAAALATGTELRIRNYEASFDDMRNNLTLAERMRDYCVKVLDAGHFDRAPDSFGSIDMGNVSHVVPAIHVLIDITGGKKIAAHTHEFCRAAATDYADAALIRAGKALALTGFDVLDDPAFLAAAKAEFAAAAHTA